MNTVRRNYAQLLSRLQNMNKYNFKTKYFSALLLAIAGQTNVVYAQDSFCSENNFVQHLEGNWKSIFYAPDEGGVWGYSDTYITNIISVLDSKGVQSNEILRAKNWTQFQTYTMLCDPANGDYKLVFMDIVANVLSVDLYVGTPKDNVLSFENMTTSIDPKSIEKNEFWKISFTIIDNDHFQLYGASTIDEGKNWIPAAKIEYFREALID